MSDAQAIPQTAVASHVAEDVTPASVLPPAKGDSDTRGRTPDDIPAPDDALLDVRGLKTHFPIRRGFLSRASGRRSHSCSRCWGSTCSPRDSSPGAGPRESAHSARGRWAA